MQKAVRRAALASKQAQRRAKIDAAKDKRYEWKAAFRERVEYNRFVAKDGRNEKLHRREDWMRGPLAPRRNAGQEDGIYGTVSAMRMQPPRLYEKEKSKFINFAAGDRVVVIRGRDKGKISKITSVSEDTGTVTVEGLNQHDVAYPSFALKNDQDPRPYRPNPVPIPFKDVRLVVPLDDPDTGAVKDVVVKHVYGGEPYIEPAYGSTTPKHTRYIAGLDIEIPWPEEDPADFKDEDVDTLRIEVDQKTYLPSLLEAPMPLTVIDELRNKFSKYRVHHDAEYITEKEREDAIEEWRKSQRLLTPQSEFHARQVAKKQAELETMKDESGNYKLSDETAKFIEQFMAAKHSEAGSKMPKKATSPAAS